MQKQALYDNFHSLTASGDRVISENNFTYWQVLQTINKFLKPKDKILDIGCGAGTLSLYYANKGNNVTGIDISNNAISACKESARKLGLKNTKFEVMNFPYEIPKGTYDFVIFTEVIEHLKNDKLAFKKIYSLLNKNGRALITTPSENAPLHKWEMAKEFDKRVGHLRRYNMAQLKKMCEDQGFEIIYTKKTEGIIRNFLFLNPIAGKFVRFIKSELVNIVSLADNISLKLFGESNLFLVIKK